MELKNSQIQNLILYVGDVIGITVGYFIMTYIRLYSGEFSIFYYLSDWVGDSRILYRWLIAVFMLTLVYLLFYPNKDFFKRKFKEELLCNIKTNAMTGLFIATIAYLIKDADQYSRFIYFMVIGFSICWMQLFHCLYRKWILDNRGKTNATRKVLIIVSRKNSKEIVTNIIKEKASDLWVTGVIVVDEDLTGTSICDIPVVAGLSDMYLYATRSVVDEVFIQSDCFTHSYMKYALSEFENMGIKVNLSIDLPTTGSGCIKNLGKVGSYYTIAYSVNEIPMHMLLGKRLLDIVGGCVGLIITGALTLILGPLIKLESPGPIFFSQERVGRNGRIFKIYKFRSMYADAEERKKELMEKNEMNGLMFKMKDDPRITKIGKFIRKTSLDEFPQFWNVLKGDMSLVGTRPPTVDEFRQYDGYHKKRLSMTPGLTGVWQVSGRSDITDFEEVVHMDVEYIENWTLKRDIDILFKTVQVVLSSESGAR